MTLYPPLWMQAQAGDTAPQYNALTDRQFILSLWETEGPVAGLKVSQRGAGANMSVDISTGIGVITGNDVSPQGTYMVSSDEVENRTIPAPPVSGSRKHRVVAYVRDRLYDGTLPDGTYDWDFVVLEDTGSGTPDAPPTAITLAYVNVAAGQISVTDTNIEDRRLNALSRPGRARQVADVASRPAVPVVAEEIWRLDLLVKEIWDGSGWREIPRRGGGGSAWMDWTPTLTALSTSPTMGTGAVRVGGYEQVGKRVTCRGTLKFGTSGASAGSGIYEVSLPVTPRSLSPSRQQGSATAFSHGGDFVDGTVFIEAGATRARFSFDSTVVTNVWPWTWANNDQMDFTITYEAA